MSKVVGYSPVCGCIEEPVYKIDKATPSAGPWGFCMYDYQAYRLVNKVSWWRGVYVDWEPVVGTGSNSIMSSEGYLRHVLLKEKLEAKLPIYLGTMKGTLL